MAQNTFEQKPTEKWKFMNITCRLCSLECQSSSHDIFEEKILEMIEVCSSLSPSETDQLPRRICFSCLQSLTNSYLFWRQIETSDVLLKEKLKKLFIKQEVIDIASNDVAVGSLHGNTVVKREKNAEETSGNIQSTINVKVENSTVQYGNIKDENNGTHKSKPNEEEVKFSKSDSGTQKISHYDPLPPLIPIKHGENSKTNISSQIPPESLPPLVPLITSNSTPTEITTTELSKNCNNVIILDNYHKESSKLLFCNICKQKFWEVKKLIGHLKGHVASKNFDCVICGKKYPNRSTFEIHMRSHTGERPFKCPVCDKGFARWAGVVSHMQSHDDNRPFKCNSCDQSFKILSNLERHKVLHSGVLPFCCDYCGNTFSQSANLQLHIRTHHTKERPYLCSECGMRYASSAKLKRHMRVHTGHKKCKYCSKSFLNIHDLRDHDRNVHRKVKGSFKCNVCDKSFPFLSRLTKHSKMHQRPYACKQCKKTFGVLKSLELHIARLHSKGHSTNSVGSGNNIKIEIKS